MKLSPDSTFPLIVLMTCVELFGFVTAHRANKPQGKNGLQTLYEDMRQLFRIVPPESEYNFEKPLTFLPRLNFTTKDLQTLEVSSTLAQLYSGLTSFKFHLDWIQQKQDEMGDDDSNTKKITRIIQKIKNLVLAQIGTPPSELVHPPLPPLKTAWNLHQAIVEIHDKLYNFCHWYTRALGVLRNKKQQP